MSRRGDVRVLFRAAAGPRVGLGHLVRSGVLARALPGEAALSLRAASATLAAVRVRGLRVLEDRSLAALETFGPDLVVVDDPSPREARSWVRAARRFGVPVATVHDLGLGCHEGAFAVDGSIWRPAGTPAADLEGPAFAILDPSFSAWRERRLARQPADVVVALGGGAHVQTLGPMLAARIRRIAPDAHVSLAPGLLAHRTRPLPPGCRWLLTPDNLAPALATAAAAVVAGGVTLYEACALGTPIVTLAAAPAQRPTTRAFARAGAVLDASLADRDAALDRAATLVTRLLARPREAARLGRRARRLVDGGGARRVARCLLGLVVAARGAEDRHVA